MFQHLIIHFSLHYLSKTSGRLREVKNKVGKFQTFNSYDDIFQFNILFQFSWYYAFARI